MLAPFSYPKMPHRVVLPTRRAILTAALPGAPQTKRLGAVTTATLPTARPAARGWSTLIMSSSVWSVTAPKSVFEVVPVIFMSSNTAGSIETTGTATAVSLAARSEEPIDSDTTIT